jgi:uroporphyrin-3 C-methyltransferase
MKEKRQTNQTNNKADNSSTAAQNTTKKGVGVIGGLALFIALGASAVSAYLYTELQKFSSQTSTLVKSSNADLKSNVDSQLLGFGEKIDSISNDVGTFSTKVDASTDDFSKQIQQLNKAVDDKTQAAMTELANNTAVAVQELTTKTESEITSLSNKTTALQQSLQEETETRLAKVSSAMEQLNKKVNTTHDVATRGQRDWILAEVDYLLRTGGYRVALAGDTKSAVLALRSASQRLHDLGDARYSPVRAQISEEVAELREVGQPDIEGVAFELQKLSKRADRLPLPSGKIQVMVEEVKKDPTQLDPKAMAEEIFQSLKNLVKVEQADGTPAVRPGKPTREQLTASESLRLNLQAARLSALRRDQQTFIIHISSTEEYVRSHYDINDDITKAYLEDLAALKTQHIVPVVSKIGQALTLFTQIHSKRGEK